MRKDLNKFRQKWRSKFSHRNSKPANVNGMSTDEDIANCFSNSFAAAYFDSYVDSSRVSNFLCKLNSVISLDSANGIFDGTTMFDVTPIVHGLNCLKASKSSGIDDLCKENILYAHPSVIIHLKLLFNMICAHGFVPDAFG